MENNNKKSRTLDQTFFLVKGKDGRARYYSCDPMQHEDPSPFEVDLAEMAIRTFGGGDVINPVMIRIAGMVKERGRRFDIGAAGRIRSGMDMSHIENLAGDFVEILESHGDDVLFPIRGVVLHRDGSAVGISYFSTDGRCKDGDRRHSLIVVNRPLSVLLPRLNADIPEASSEDWNPSEEAEAKAAAVADAIENGEREL